MGRGESKPGGQGEQGGQGQRRGFGTCAKDFSQTQQTKRWAGEKPSQVGGGNRGTGNEGVRACVGAAKDFTFRNKKPSQVGRGETKPGGPGRDQARWAAGTGGTGTTMGVWACIGAAKDFTLRHKKPSQVGRGDTKPGGPGRNQARWAGGTGGTGATTGFGHALEPLKISLSETKWPGRNQARWAGEKPSQVGGGNRGDRGNDDGGLGMLGAAKDFTLTKRNQARWAGEKPSQVGRGETKPGGRGEQGGQGQRRGFGHALEPLKISLSETRNQARWAGEKPNQVGGGKGGTGATTGVWAACVGAAKDVTLRDKKPSQVGRGETKPGGRGGTGGTGATTGVWACIGADKDSGVRRRGRERGQGGRMEQGQRREFAHALESTKIHYLKTRKSTRETRMWAGGGRGERGDTTTGVWACIGATKDFTLSEQTGAVTAVRAVRAVKAEFDFALSNQQDSGRGEAKGQ